MSVLLLPTKLLYLMWVATEELRRRLLPLLRFLVT